MMINARHIFRGACGPTIFLYLSLISWVQGENVTEYQIKAVFLFNFISFIVWPNTSDTPPAEIEFNVCVLGTNPFTSDLDSLTTRIKAEKGMHSKIYYLTELSDIKHCHILYLSASEQHRQQEFIEHAAAYPLLTISSIEGFARNGGMIEFYTKANKVRFIINLPILRQAQLKIDANLLRVADVIAEPAP
jgi:hypothetical protein